MHSLIKFSLSALKLLSSNFCWKHQSRQAVTCSKNTKVANWQLGSAELLNLLNHLWMKPHMVPTKTRPAFIWRWNLSLFDFYCISMFFPTYENGSHFVKELFLTCNCSLQYGASDGHGCGWSVAECTHCWQWQWFSLRISLLTLSWVICKQVMQKH